MTEKIKVSCGHCGATNNFPMASIGKRVVCGRCKAPLPAPGTALEPGPAGFATLLGSAALPLLVFFHSRGCGYCSAMHRPIEELARRRKGELMVLKVDIERDPAAANRLSVMAVPTVVILHRGVERGRLAGARSEAELGLWAAGLV